ncbi:hypothetical protein DPMN_154056 [Dreissena polymorpha]|uniref:Uncharacterized protein n=1 Tax=Dreissena polymorpha TaxID=45954 RepID=A0A9D4FK95_DREPO|nr:hypothetical protein DPMN_154056 [Dreissena polymorpha]
MGESEKQLSKYDDFSQAVMVLINMSLMGGWKFSQDQSSSFLTSNRQNAGQDCYHDDGAL